MLEEAKPDAEQSLRREAVIAAIVEKEGINPGDDDLEQALEHSAEHEGITPAELLEKLRGRIDDLVLRTTFITGFPGETRPQFEEMVEFARRWRFERVGVFTYSLEPDTPAARLDGHLPEEEKQARRDELMGVQQPIAHEHARRQVGKIRDVIIDRGSDVREDVWIGRTTADAPDIDCAVYVTAPGTSAATPLVGKILPVEIVAASGYDLAGVPAEG
jgi:ribosomal protein S12 methylthiotransferase